MIKLLFRVIILKDDFHLAALKRLIFYLPNHAKTVGTIQSMNGSIARTESTTKSSAISGIHLLAFHRHRLLALGSSLGGMLDIFRTVLSNLLHLL
ncbi:MAG: hypothetical protein WC364_04755 [Eubacteriales bacterium]